MKHNPTQTQHTPTPWSVENDTDIIATDGGFVATSHDPRSDVGTATEYADAAFIVHACNSHEQLVRLLQLVADSDVLGFPKDPVSNLPLRQAIRAALSAALPAAKE